MAKPKIPRINWADPLAKGLILAVPINEGYGFAFDYGLNKGVGTLNGSAAWAQDEDGWCVDFNRSTTTYIDIPYNPIFNVPNITVACLCVYDTAGHTLSTAVSKWDGTNNSFLLGLGSTADTFRFAPYVSDGLRNGQSDASYFSAGAKRFLVGTFNGTATKLFIDGIEAGSTSQTPNAPLDPDPVSIRIGGRNSATTGHFWDGKIHLVLLYNYAMHDNSIVELAQDPYRIFYTRKYFQIQQLVQVGTAGFAQINVIALTPTVVTPTVGIAGLALINVNALSSTGLLSQADVVLATTETYQILKAESTPGGAFFVLDVGQENLFKYQLPYNIWHDARCEHVYRSVGQCDYGRSEFEGLEKMDIKTGGDGDKKIQGWFARNFGSTDIVFADIHITNGNYYSVKLKSIANFRWNPGAQTAPWLYKKFAATNFTFELDTSGDGNESEESEGYLIAKDGSDTPSVWLHFRKQYKMGVNHIVASKCTDGFTEDTIFDVLAGSDKLLKIEKINEVFNFYTRPSDAVAWVKNGSTTVEDLNNVPLRIGLAACTNSAARTTDFTAKFDYFRLLSGGLATCDNVLDGTNGCRAHDNSRRYGGAPGILKGPIIL